MLERDAVGVAAAAGTLRRPLRARLLSFFCRSWAGARISFAERTNQRVAKAATPTTSRSTASKADQGISKAESSALLDETAHEQRMSQSFWRFG